MKKLVLNRYTLIMFFLVIVDQISKVCVLDIKSKLKVIKNLFYIRKTYNTGAAWNVMMGQEFILIMTGIAALVLIYVYFIRKQKLTKTTKMIYAFLYAGIIGNLIDRITKGYVIDFIDIYIFGYDFPIFNIADMYIVISVIALLISEFRSSDKDAICS